MTLIYMMPIVSMNYTIFYESGKTCKGNEIECAVMSITTIYKYKKVI